MKIIGLTLVFLGFWLPKNSFCCKTQGFCNFNLCFLCFLCFLSFLSFWRGFPGQDSTARRKSSRQGMSPWPLAQLAQIAQPFYRVPGGGLPGQTRIPLPEEDALARGGFFWPEGDCLTRGEWPRDTVQRLGHFSQLA